MWLKYLLLSSSLVMMTACVHRTELDLKPEVIDESGIPQDIILDSDQLPNQSPEFIDYEEYHQQSHQNKAIHKQSKSVANKKIATSLTP